MMLRSGLGVIVGALIWMVLFFTLARGLFTVWPEYAVNARAWTADGTYNFTAPMSGFNAAFWFLAEVGAGWLTVVIARRREAGWVLAALLMAYLSLLHLYLYWPNFPWWYNLVVALPSGFAVLLGGRLARGWARPPRAS